MKYIKLPIHNYGRCTYHHVQHYIIRKLFMVNIQIQYYIILSTYTYNILVYNIMRSGLKIIYKIKIVVV